MKSLTKCSLAIAIAACLLGDPAWARNPQTIVSTDKDPLKDSSIVVCTPVTQKGGLIKNFLGKVLNIPNSVKINEIGYLFNALSMDALQAKPADPKGFHTTVVLPYLKSSKELEDSLKLRRTARQIKFKTVSESLKKVNQLTEEQKSEIGRFLSQQIGAPILVLDKSPLPVIMASPGPCMIPMGLEVIDPKSGKRIGLETSVICVLDIESGGEKLFSVQEALNNDTLDLVLAHENAHAIMFDMYGKMFTKIRRISTNGHDAPYITDLGMGLTEGWAEAFEAVYGPANPRLAEKDRKKYNISDFLFGRQNPIRRDRYVWARPIGKKTGVPKNGLQLLCTEGVVAGQFYDILTSKSIAAPFEKCVTTMLLAQPLDYRDFIKAFVKLFPDDKKVVYRILLEGMNYVTMHKDAARLYQEAYTAKVAFTQKKTSKEAYLKARNAFNQVKEELFAKAAAGADPFANVGPEMWFSGVLKDTPTGKEKAGPDTPFNLDLNTVSSKMLVALGAEQADAEKLIAQRNAAGFFTGDPLKVLAAQLGAEKFAAMKAKSGLKAWQPPAEPTASGNQARVMWPEDIEKLAIVEN